MSKLLKGVGLLFAALAAVCLARVALLPAPATSGAAVPAIELDEAGAVERMAGALRFPTVSQTDRTQIDPKPLDDLAAYFERSFPHVHARLAREKVGQSLLFTWAGADPSARPLLLLAHMDVVPVEPGTEANWTHPPFGGVVADGQIWGRGARDDKSSVLALLEAAEWLLTRDFKPPRTVYLAFGHDEEIGGEQGAAKIAALLQSRGVSADLLDEGSGVLERMIGGVERPVAAIMAAEKGYYTVRLTARAEGGHSSRPPSVTAVGRLARAVWRVQQNPMPTRLVAPVTDMLDRIAPEVPFAQRLVLANRWLFGRLIRSQMAGNQTQNTLVRTTTAPTVIHAGIKDNVLPSEAYALINFRLLPGDSREDVLAHLREVIGDDGIELKGGDGGFGNEASVPSPIDSSAFRLLERTTREIFPEAVVSTGLVTGATDARNYEGVYATRYNFAPQVLTPEDLPTIHGTNERIGVDNYLRMVRFYVQLLRNTAGEP